MTNVIPHKQAEIDLRSQNEYLALLNEMTRAILLSNDYDATMRALVSNMKEIIKADDCYLMRWDEEMQLAIPVITTAKLDFPFTETGNIKELSVTASILEAGRIVAMEDVSDTSYVSIKVAKKYPVHSIIGVPLIAGNKKLGVAIIAFNTHHSFTATELEHVEQAGNQVALALLQLQQNLEIQRRLKESNTLTEISRALSETERGGTDKVLQLIVDLARDLIQKADESVIHLVEVEEDMLVSRAISGFDKETNASERPRLGLKEGVSGHVIKTGETINISDIYTSSLYVLKDASPNHRSLLVAPIKSGGEPIGTISVQSDQINAFSASDVDLLGKLSVQATIALENTRLFETTQQSLKR